MKKKEKNDKKKKQVSDKLPRDNKGTRRFLRIIVWLLIGFLLLRGAASLLNNDNLEVQVLADELRTYMENPPVQVDKIPIVKGTAAHYLREYLSFNGDKNERDKRLSELSDARVNENFNSNILKTEPLGIEVYETELINENEINVSLLSKIEVTSLGEKESEEGERPLVTSISTDYYRVTVYINEEGVVIKNVPIVLPVPVQKIVMRNRSINYTSVDRDEKKEIEESLNSFFKAYYEGTMKDISYVTTLKYLRGLDGSYKFEGIEKSDSRINENNEFFSTVSIRLSNDIKSFTTSYEMTLTKVEDQYLVTSFDVTNKEFEEHYLEEEME